MNKPTALDINDARARMIEEATGHSLLGLPIDASAAQADGLGRRLWETHLPILWCLCVQDSPANPCPCTGPIVWIPRAAVLQSGPTNRRSEDGRAIERVVVRRETELVIDAASRVAVERFLAEQGVRGSRHSEGQLCGDLLLPAPQQTTQDSGILWYRVQVDEAAKSVVILAFDGDGREAGRHVTRQTNEQAFSFAIERGETRLEGQLALIPQENGGLVIRGHLDAQEFKIVSVKGKAASCEAEERLCLNTVQFGLLSEWGRIGQPLMILSRGADGTAAKKGCFSCLVLGAAISVGAGCCVAGNPACCVGAGVGGSTFIDECKGACA
jgi:hypothetical protein